MVLGFGFLDITVGIRAGLREGGFRLVGFRQRVSVFV